MPNNLLAILLGINLLGGYTIVSSLADIRYIECRLSGSKAGLSAAPAPVCNKLPGGFQGRRVVKYTAAGARSQLSGLESDIRSISSCIIILAAAAIPAGDRVELELRLRKSKTIFMVRPRFKGF